MKIDFDLSLLPSGWELDGIWYDKNEEKHLCWTADASLPQYPRENKSNPYRTILSAEAQGATPQEALEKLPAVIAENIKLVLESINLAANDKYGDFV